MPDQQSRTEDFFDRIDGLEYPELLICPDCANLPPTHIPANPRIRPTTIAKRNAKETSTENAADPIQYNIKRSLQGECDSYSMELCLGEKGIQAAIDAQRAILKTDLVTAVDLGCGTGVALEELLRLRGIDPRSIGLTLSEEARIVSQVRQNILIENILNLKPKASAGTEPIRAGIAFSVFGAVIYHPLNRSEGNTTFGLLHMINLLAENGLGLISTPQKYDKGLKTMATLRELGIIETPEDLKPYATSEVAFHENAFRVKRRPTFEEIAILLEIEGDGSYSTFGLPY